MEGWEGKGGRVGGFDGSRSQLEEQQQVGCSSRWVNSLMRISSPVSIVQFIDQNYSLSFNRGHHSRCSSK